MKVIRRSETPDPMLELKYLPIFYLFPQELIDQCEFRDFPRNPYTVLHSEKWMSLYNSERFIEVLSDGLGRMVWRHFGIKASLESFSGYYPFWVVARSGTWIEIAAQKGFNTYTLAAASPDYQFQPPSMERAQELFAGFVEEGRKLLPLDDWIAVVNKYPAEEDYEPSRKSRASMAFYRKWYHTRTLTKMEFVGNHTDWETIAGTGASPWDAVDYELDLERFQNTLSETDRCVFEQMHKGYTQAQIAQGLGFSNHSAISKRMKKIRTKYLEYIEINNTEMDESPVVRDNWTEMQDLLFPK